MASTLLGRLADPVIRRAVEETAERAMRDAAADGATDENSVARRFYRLIMAADSPLRDAVNAIPGFRYIPHVGLTLAAEYLRDNAQGIFPGDSRPLVRGLRHVLQGAAPALEGVGTAAADVLEGQIDAAVNTTVASPRRPGVKGRLDLVRVWLADGRAHLVIPTLDAGGTVTLDTFGDPVPANFDAAQMARWLSDEFTVKGTRRERSKDGKTTREVSVPPKKRDLTDEIGLRAAIQLLGGPEGLNPEQLARLEELLKPVATWESRISPNVDAVLSWYVDALSFKPLRISALTRQEAEELVDKMRKLRTEPEWVNRRLGRFRPETDGFPLSGAPVFTPAQFKQMRRLFDRIRDEIDVTLGGDQSPLTQARKGLEVLPDVRKKWKELKKKNPEIQLGLDIWIGTLVLALLLLLVGIFFPVALYPGWTGVVFVAACAGGVLGFAITWPFPIAQRAFSLLEMLIPGAASADTINSLGRKIASFALCVGAGVLPLTIWLEFPVIVRVGIVAFGALFPIGISYGLREAGASIRARRIVQRSLMVANFVFGTLAVLVFFLVGFLATTEEGYVSGPAFVAGFSDTASAVGENIWARFMGSKEGQFLLLLLVTIPFALLAKSTDQARVVGDSAIKERAPLLRFVPWILLVFGALAILFHDPANGGASDIDLVNSQVSETDLTLTDGKSKVRVREKRYEDGTSRTRVSGRLDARSVTPAPTPTPVVISTPPPFFDKTALCADSRVSPDRRLLLRCP